LNGNKFFYLNYLFIFAPQLAGVAELVDALDLGSSALWRGGSSPFARTRKTVNIPVMANVGGYLIKDG
jgi:hypothetical protein